MRHRDKTVLEGRRHNPAGLLGSVAGGMGAGVGFRIASELWDTVAGSAHNPGDMPEIAQNVLGPGPKQRIHVDVFSGGVRRTLGVYWANLDAMVRILEDHGMTVSKQTLDKNGTTVLTVQKGGRSRRRRNSATPTTAVVRTGNADGDLVDAEFIDNPREEGIMRKHR